MEGFGDPAEASVSQNRGTLRSLAERDNFRRRDLPAGFLTQPAIHLELAVKA
jgi:hypothetical protein